MQAVKRRVIIIDDTANIHEDFKMILSTPESKQDLDAMAEKLFGDQIQKKSTVEYILSSAFSGQEGFKKVCEALSKDEPFHLAFVDMRMPPGWDGLQTIKEIFAVDKKIQVVICTAYSDYSWEDIYATIGDSDRLLFLRKPFDTTEVYQMAAALTEKWHLAQAAELKFDQINELVKVRTQELEEANLQLQVEVETRKKAEEEIKQKEKKFRTLFNSTKDAIFVHGMDEVNKLPTAFSEVNNTACERLGYTREEFMSMTVADIDHPSLVEKMPLIMSRLVLTGAAIFEGCHVAKDKRQIPVELSAHIFNYQDKKMILSIARDITERKNAERERERVQKQLQQTSKLAALGELAGGVAHELNNPLAVIQTYVDQIEEIMQEKEMLDSSTETFIAGLNRNIQRMIAIISHLKQFGRQSTGEVMELDLHKVIESAISLFERQFKNQNITIMRKYRDGELRVIGDPIQLEQIFVNFFSNAKDALAASQNKVILIKTEQSDREISVQFEDSGSGIPAEIRARIFDPFFTTKEIGKGTGLGLSITHGIMKDHNGEVQVVEEGELSGAKFRLKFPVEKY